MEERCNYFAFKQTKNLVWTFNSILIFAIFKKRVEKEMSMGARQKFHKSNKIIDFLYV